MTFTRARDAHAHDRGHPLASGRATWLTDQQTMTRVLPRVQHSGHPLAATTVRYSARRPVGAPGVMLASAATC